MTGTNSGDDSRGRVFGLEGDLYLPVAIGAMVGVALSGGLLLVKAPWELAVAIGALPLFGVVVWVLGFRHGKPAGYTQDKLDSMLGGGNFSRDEAGITHTKAHEKCPDARFVDGLLLFGTPERGGLAAKGFILEPSDRRGASIEQLNAFQDQIRELLGLIGPGRRLQVQWWPDSDYRAGLLAYHQATEGIADPLLRSVRNERFRRYWPRMLRGELRREHLAVFLSVEVTGYSGTLQTREGLREHYGIVLQELQGQFEEFEQSLRSVFGAETPVRAMDDVAHFECLRTFLNPSVARREETDAGAAFDPAQTIQEACFGGEGVGHPDGGFVLDGQHQVILALSRWPQRTRPGIVTHLTGLPFLDYRLTVNVTPVQSRSEIDREEKAAERLRGEYADRPRASLLVALQKKERKVEALAGGFARPFHVTYLVRVWAPDAESLRERVAAVQAAIHAMDGAQAFECALPATAKKLFFSSWPGWTHSSYHHRELYAEDIYLADVLPFSATFTGNLDQAEALYDGSHQNLVGVSAQVGGSPQHAVLLGMTGAGKSAFVEDLLYQTAGFFSHSLLIEEGFSYKKFTESQGETPIVIHPDAALTLNYLDTLGLPLSQLHLATAVALLARMVGVPDHPEKLALRQAQLAQYLHQLYRDTFTDWSRRHGDEAADVQRFACAVHGWRTSMAGGATPLEAFVDLRDRIAANEDHALAFVAGQTEAAITRFAQDPATERLVPHTACAYYTPEEFPTHGALVELLAFARFPEHAKEEVDRLATLLRAWTADGQYGRLFDGVTNVSLARRIAHFELGLIPEQAVEMKTAAGLLISGLGRQHILALPRAQRKRILFEELARFLDTPGGEQIVAESYAQLRKHNCWAVSIIQQYARFKQSRVRSAVIGNAKQFFLMRQNDRGDLADLSADLPLPEAAIEAIQRYPLPEQLADDRRHSSLCYFTPTSQPPQCGTLRHFQPEEPCAEAA
ncbi:MAG: hypothetical protein JWM32_1587 [Verrucomicrobia bacterium]|nr:hypothetical protein [Verrucomicrobiota bacterium]